MKSKSNTTNLWQDLSNSFKGGWEAVVSILKFILQAIVTLIPFGIVIPVGGIVLGIVFRDKIKSLQKNKENQKKPR